MVHNAFQLSKLFQTFVYLLGGIDVVVFLVNLLRGEPIGSNLNGNFLQSWCEVVVIGGDGDTFGGLIRLVKVVRVHATVVAPVVSED